MFKSGFAAVIGRANVGKSTLINSLIGEKLLIVSDKPQATRNKIRCILNTEGAQVIFLDTPGIHKPRHGLGQYMLKTALNAMEEVDVLLFVVEAHLPPGPGDRYIADLLTQTATPSILVLNKIDLLKDDGENIKNQYKALAPFRETIAVSSKTGENMDKLLEAVISLLPPGPKYYPEDVIVDQPERFIAAELIREKLLSLTREEIPHSVAVTVEEMRAREDREIVDIRAVIYVERESQKGIIIGKGGRLLKEAGTLARHDLEKLLGNRIFLELWVKVKKDWRNRERYLKEFGYGDDR